jgi:hypothetical protein
MGFRYSYSRVQDQGDAWGEPPQGGTGGDANFLFTQTVASATWQVQHNLGKCPSVTIADSSGHQVVGDVVHNSVNDLTVFFSAPFAGSAYLN